MVKVIINSLNSKTDYKFFKCDYKFFDFWKNRQEFIKR